MVKSIIMNWSLNDIIQLSYLEFIMYTIIVIIVSFIMTLIIIMIIDNDKGDKIQVYKKLGTTKLDIPKSTEISHTSRRRGN